MDLHALLHTYIEERGFASSYGEDTCKEGRIRVHYHLVRMCSEHGIAGRFALRNNIVFVEIWESIGFAIVVCDEKFENQTEIFNEENFFIIFCCRFLRGSVD